MAMSLCGDTLSCNFPKCRAKLTGFAWVTACSHAFCDQHGSSEFSHAPAICPACSSILSGKLDIVRTEMSPSEEYKAMVLAGLQPDIVLDISTRALAFWSYQVYQERMYQGYKLSRAEADIKKMEKVLTQQHQSREMELGTIKGELASLKKVTEEYKRKYSEVSERLMERNRQYQKLQGLYDSLRLRNMVVGDTERGTPLQQGYEFHTGMVHPASPQENLQFSNIDLEEEDQLFSSLEPDRAAQTFFQFSSPAKGQGWPYKK